MKRLRFAVPFVLASAFVLACSGTADDTTGPGQLSAAFDVTATAKLGKVSVCHATGNGSYSLLNVGGNAQPAHLAHGDVLPGASTEGTPVEGTPYAGLYGSTVTPITTPVSTIGADCVPSNGESTVLKISTTQNYSASGGWAGWSCLEAGYPDAIGGGVIGSTVIAEGVAEPGATIGAYTYPIFPNYTFPSGEEGYVANAQNAGTLYVLCAAL